MCHAEVHFEVAILRALTTKSSTTDISSASLRAVRKLLAMKILTIRTRTELTAVSVTVSKALRSIQHVRFLLFGNIGIVGTVIENTFGIYTTNRFRNTGRSLGLKNLMR